MVNAMKADRYAVFGNPVGHSLSPQIHAAFAEQLGQRIVYEKVLVERGGFAEAARKFFDGGGRGLNVTQPFKGDAFEFVGGSGGTPIPAGGKAGSGKADGSAAQGSISKRATLARAVNTLSLNEGGNICGDNTDGVGLVRDLTENLGWKIANKRVLILGAGGAVRGVLGPLLEQGLEELVIVNRTGSKAKALVKELVDFLKLKELYDGHNFAFSSEEASYTFHNIDADGVMKKAIKIEGGGDDLLDRERSFHLIINGTSASLTDDLPPLPSYLIKGTRCYDMMYGAQPTAFMDWAKEHGAKEVTDGLGMLVEQAAESFHIWRGAGPSTKPVITQLRNSLGAN